MWMTDYIRAVKRALRDQHGIIPNGGTPDDPTFAQVPDGEYICEIDGKRDRVVVTDMQIDCCNFEA